MKNYLIIIMLFAFNYASPEYRKLVLENDLKITAYPTSEVSQAVDVPEDIPLIEDASHAHGAQVDN